MVDDWKQTWKQVASRLKRQVHIYTQSDTHTPEVWSTRPDGFPFLQQSTSPLAAYLQKNKRAEFFAWCPYNVAKSPERIPNERVQFIEKVQRAQNPAKKGIYWTKRQQKISILFPTCGAFPLGFGCPVTFKSNKKIFKILHISKYSIEIFIGL